MRNDCDLTLGIDIGSTTAKIVVVDRGAVLFEKYQRHFSQVRQKTLELLDEAAPYVGERSFTAAISGSAGLGLAESAGVSFVQEVFATGEVVRRLEPDAGAVIELGGEDAKIIFFDGGIDERMNGSCAGGTGAFIDQMASLLNITADELDELSLQSTRLYPIASRCGVFAKTDIQPLLNQGAKHSDVAASIYQAVVNQTIAGLAQGKRIGGKVLFLGGPLYYCKGLRRRFQETLKLDDEHAVFPEYGRFAVAMGAALYAEESGGVYTMDQLREKIVNSSATRDAANLLPPLFRSEADYGKFRARHAAATVAEGDLADDGANNDGVKSVKEFAAQNDSEVFVICAQIEQEIAELDDDEKAMFLEDMGITQSGLDKLIAASYRILGLMSFLTAGEDETRAWTIKIGTKAPQAAGKIHTDFERGFIKAEVVNYKDLLELGSLAAAREKGLVGMEGKEYVVQDGDVILFRFNV